MKRSEFLISLGALIVAPFLPRQKLVRMPPNWNHGGTHDDRPNVFHRKINPETMRIIKEANRNFFGWETKSRKEIDWEARKIMKVIDEVRRCGGMK